MRTTFHLLRWLMLSSCDGRESGAALRMPTFPQVQFRHSQHAIERFFPNIHTLIRILCTLPITSAECGRSFSTLKKIKNIPEVDHVKRARVWAGVDEHQLLPRHKYRGSDKDVRSTTTKASSVCVA